MASESYNCSPGVGWAIDDVFLARVADICEYQIVECGADKRMRIGYLFWPKIEDLTGPRGNVTNNSKVVNEGVEVAAARLEVAGISQFAKVGIFGILQKRLGEIFNRWISEISSCG